MQNILPKLKPKPKLLLSSNVFGCLFWYELNLHLTQRFFLSRKSLDASTLDLLVFNSRTF